MQKGEIRLSLNLNVAALKFNASGACSHAHRKNEMKDVTAAAMTATFNLNANAICSDRYANTGFCSYI